MGGSSARWAKSARWAGTVLPCRRQPGDAAMGGAAPGPYCMRCDAVAERYGLSPQERDVFDLLVRGRSIDYIAQNLTISFNTAKSHIRHIYVKADVHSPGAHRPHRPRALDAGP